MLLEVRGASVSYHMVRALHRVTMDVPAGGIVTIIGANGAGKTTALRAVSGLAPLSEGEIVFDGERISGLAPNRIAARGIGHVPEGRRVFPDLTVEENLSTGAFLRRDAAGGAQRLRDGVLPIPAPRGASEAVCPHPVRR